MEISLFLLPLIVPIGNLWKFDYYVTIVCNYKIVRRNLISLCACDLLRTHEVCHVINGSECPTKFAMNDVELSPNRRSANTVGKAAEVCYQLTYRRTMLFIIYYDGGLASAITTRSFQEVWVFSPKTG